MGNKSFIPLGLPHEQSAREAEAAEKRAAALRQKEEAASSKRAASGNKKKKSISKKPVEETESVRSNGVAAMLHPELRTSH